VRSILLIQKSRDKTYIEEGKNETQFYTSECTAIFIILVHPGCHTLISYYVISWINSEIIIMVVDGNLQNLHVVSVVLQEFHAFGECKIRHAVTLNCCALIKIKHAQRRSPIRKPNKRK